MSEIQELYPLGMKFTLETRPGYVFAIEAGPYYAFILEGKASYVLAKLMKPIQPITREDIDNILNRYPLEEALRKIKELEV